MCNCETISVSLKNHALIAQGRRGGVYRNSSIINGLPSWISNSQAIWYTQELNKWVIGPLDQIGTIYSAIAGKNGFSCPFDIPSEKWKYVQNGIWASATSNEISVNCLKGIFPN